MSNFVPPDPLVLTGNLNENWKRFKKQFNIYMTATDFCSKPQKRQVAILLNLIGKEALDLYDSFSFKEDEELKLNKVMKSFEEYCNPKKNILLSRSLFYNRKQKEGEPFDTFVTDVKTMVRDCDFAAPLEMLCDKIVFDSNDIETRDAIIKLGKINLEDAIEKYRLAETTKKQTSQTHAEKEEVNAQEKEINAITVQIKTPLEKSVQCESKPPDRYINCKFCGRRHIYAECPARGKQCTSCYRFHHFANVCHMRNQKTHQVEKVQKKVTFDLKNNDKNNCNNEGVSQQNVTRVRRFQRELEAAEDRAETAESNLSLIRTKHRSFVTTSSVPGSQVYLVQETRTTTSEM